MDQSTKTDATPGFRVEHKYTGKQGTVTATGADSSKLGQHLTVKWDNDDAQELPTVLHTRHLDVVPERQVNNLSQDLREELTRRGFTETINEGTFVEFAGPVLDRNTYKIKPVFNTVSGFEFFLDHGEDSSAAFTLKEMCDLHKHTSLLLQDLGFDVEDWAANFGRLPMGAR